MRFLRDATPWVVPAALAVALTAIDCGRSHDLGIGGASSSSSSSPSSSAGPGGAGGAATVGSGGASSSSTSGPGTGAGPSGPTRLTIVDGINDYPAVLFCFLPNDTPWPGPAGLAFAAGQPVDVATALPSGTDVTLWVVAGDLATVAGSTCTQILAMAQPPGGSGGAGGAGTGGTSSSGAGGGSAGGGGTGGGAVDAGSGDAGSSDGGSGDGGVPPRPIIATEIGVIPQSVLSSDASLLLVPTGCMGGPGHDVPNPNGICGTGYTSTTPTTSVVLLGMSRKTDPAHVSLQAVNASAVLPPSDIDVVPNLNGSPPVVVAPSLGTGAIGPMPPFAGLDVSAFGPLDGVQVGAYSPGSMSPSASVKLGTILSASQVGAAGFVNGAGLVLVGVGSAPGQPTGSFWHALTFALVKADPG